MDKPELQKTLSSLPLAGLRYFESTGSTNDEASAWASQGALDLSLVVADEQTAGRGRAGRKWFTPRATALALSLILRPSAAERTHPARTTGLGALALVDSLRTRGLAPQIKWPNDVLLNGRKVAGILVESVWSGETLEALILGMGVNVLADSLPPAEELLFPATSLRHELGHDLDRTELLKETLSALIEWRAKLHTPEFVKAWEEALAFRGQQVQLSVDQQLLTTGELLGLTADGSLRIRTADGETRQVQFGEIHLRPTL